MEFGKIFINYRREDAQHAAGRLYDAFEGEFSREQLFIDIDHIEEGSDFADVLQRQVAQCDVLLAVIGPHWASARDPKTNARRIDNANDFVRIEIEAARDRDITIIPVLIDDTPMPPPEAFPESIRIVNRLQLARVRHEQFKEDARRIFPRVRKAFEEARLRRDAERRRREAKVRRGDFFRAPIEDPDKKPNTDHAEYADWNRIRKLTAPDIFRKHMSAYPEGYSHDWAWERLEALEWARVRTSKDQSALRRFVHEFPGSPQASVARERVAKLETDAQAAAEKHRRETEAKAAWDALPRQKTMLHLRNFAQKWEGTAPGTKAAADFEKIKDRYARFSERLRDWLFEAGRVALNLIAIGFGLIVLVYFIQLGVPDDAPTGQNAPPAAAERP